MSRFIRKKREDISYKGGSLTDVFDNYIKGSWYINDDEYDYICENATDEEIEYFIFGDTSFGAIRKSMNIVDRLLKEMYE